METSPLESQDPRSSAAFPAPARPPVLVGEIPDYLWSAAIRAGTIEDRCYSPVVEALTGYSPEEHLARPELWLECVHPEDRARVRGAVQQLVAGRTILDEYRIVHRDGTVRWVLSQIRPTCEADGVSIRLDGVVTDITRRRRAEAEGSRRGRWLGAVRRIAGAVNSTLDLAPILESTVEQLWGVIPAARIVILELQPGGEEVEVVACRGETEGFRQLGERFSLGPHLREVFATRRQKHVPAFETRTAGFTGSACYVPVSRGDECVAALIVYRRPPDAFDAEDCEFLETVGTHVSIAVNNATVLADLRSAQRAAVEIERVRAIGDVAAGVAHDFNNLLAAILGNAQLGLAQGVTLEEARRRLAVIEIAAMDGAVMIERVRHLAEPEALVAATSVDLADVARDAVELLRPRWADSNREPGTGVRLVTQFTPAVVMGNGTELRECVANLILNAVLAMPRGGTLTVRTGATESTAWLDVADSGDGMTPEVRERIWEPYFTTRGSRSSGIGLSVCRQILDRHHAQVAVETEPGAGTTIRCLIPILGRPAPAAAPPAEPTLQLGDPAQRVLLVDDDAMVREVHSLALEQQGFAVLSASGAEEALGLIQATSFSIAVLDQRMPGVSGTDLAALLEERWPDLPVILLTGLGADARNEVRSGNVRLILGKPVGLRHLAQAVVDVLKA